jgi:hypothetical protein
MAQYMLLVGGADLDKRIGSPERSAVILERYMAWMRSLQERGHYVAAHKLHDQTGKRLTVRGGQVVDAPFVETKEAIGGLFVIQAESLEEATEIARGCPVLLVQNGYVEVRTVEERPRAAS